jgi:hypothetical protein
MNNYQMLELKISLLTWNLGGSPPDEGANYVFQQIFEDDSSLFFINFQELSESHFGNVNGLPDQLNSWKIYLSPNFEMSSKLVFQQTSCCFVL